MSDRDALLLLLRTLVNLLLTSADALVLAVACADVGQYVKHCERGKKYVHPSPDLCFSNLLHG